MFEYTILFGALGTDKVPHKINTWCVQTSLMLVKTVQAARCLPSKRKLLWRRSTHVWSSSLLLLPWAEHRLLESCLPSQVWFEVKLHWCFFKTWNFIPQTDVSCYSKMLYRWRKWIAILRGFLFQNTTYPFYSTKSYKMGHCCDLFNASI